MQVKENESFNNFLDNVENKGVIIAMKKVCEEWTNRTLKDKILILRYLMGYKDKITYVSILFPCLQLQDEEWEVIMQELSLDVEIIEEYYSHLLMVLRNEYIIPKDRSLSLQIKERLRFIERNFSIDISKQLHRFILSFRTHQRNPVLVMLISKKDEVLCTGIQPANGSQDSGHPGYVTEHIDYYKDEELRSIRNAHFFYYNDNKIIPRSIYQKHVTAQLQSVTLPELTGIIFSYVP